MNFLDTVRLDARHLVRAVRRSPGFAIVAIATLGLGIGATTAVVSVADHVLVRSLPFRDADRLMMMLESDAHGGFRTPSAPTSFDWAKDAGAARAFEGLTFIRGDGLPLRIGEETRDVGVAFVEPRFFDVLGVKPPRGRALVDDDHARDAAPVAVISHRLWQTRFAGDPNIVGRRIDLDKAPTVVVGVLPLGAVYPAFADAWQPLSHYAKPEILERRGFHADSRTLGRLRDGVDSAQAVALMSAVGGRIAAAYPAEQAGWMPTLRPMRLEIIGNLRPMLLTLSGAALAVLLLACVNIANLMLVRLATRARELAIRSAIGASRWRIGRQLLTESLLLSCIGGTLGIALAAVAVRIARTSLPIPRGDELQLDARILAIAAGTTVATALLCGLWPSLRAAPRLATQVLRAGALAAGGRSEARLRRALVTLQFALALVLLIGSGLLLQSFLRAARNDVGLDPSNLLTLRIAPPAGSYDTPREAAALYGRLLDATRAVPGVQSAFIQHTPFNAAAIFTTVEIEGRELKATDQVFYRTVSASYLATTRMKMSSGRWFDDNDMRAPAGPVIVNRQMARQYFPGVDPIGQHIVVRRASQARPDFGQRLSSVIVGVVGDVSYAGRDVPAGPEVYVPYTLETWPWGNLVMRAPGGRADIPALLRAVRSVDSRLVADGAAGVAAFGVMTDALDARLRPRKITMTLVSAFAASALLLAAIGMYGVAAYSIAQRTQEIGVRKALGATDRGIASMLLRESLIVTGAGVVAGSGAAFGAASLIRGLLFDTTLVEPVVYATTVGLLTAAALGATFVPARRAMRLDPTIAMRGD